MGRGVVCFWFSAGVGSVLLFTSFSSLILPAKLVAHWQVWHLSPETLRVHPSTRVTSSQCNPILPSFNTDLMHLMNRHDCLDTR